VARINNFPGARLRRQPDKSNGGGGGGARLGEIAHNWIRRRKDVVRLSNPVTSTLDSYEAVHRQNTINCLPVWLPARHAGWMMKRRCLPTTQYLGRLRYDGKIYGDSPLSQMAAIAM